MTWEPTRTNAINLQRNHNGFEIVQKEDFLTELETSSVGMESCIMNIIILLQFFYLRMVVLNLRQYSTFYIPILDESKNSNRRNYAVEIVRVAH